MQNNIPKILQEIAQFLKEEEKIQLSKRFADGRTNSSENQDEIVRKLVGKFDIITAKSRYWYDFAIEEKKKFFPVNIKVTNTVSADNLNCKEGIYYALTGLLPDFSSGIGYYKFLQKLKENFGTSKDNDYYFLVINKKDTSDIFVNSLKQLPKIQANGNNLPFQCKWNDNRLPVDRTFEQSAEYILKTFGKSVDLRSRVYFEFKEIFPEYYV
ncbi:MAG: hypothetical protein LBS50_06300 [Prevotellaceae bacterium]|jgi:hypothetical protein|nr:hypothetical protein [Prevotellaceae bacterium]